MENGGPLFELVIQGLFAGLTGYLIIVWIPRMMRENRDERTAEWKIHHEERQQEWDRQEATFTRSLQAVQDECARSREDFRASVDRLTKALEQVLRGDQGK